MAAMVQLQQILNKVKESAQFAIMVDETKRLSKKKSRSANIVICSFVHDAVCEAFSGFMPAHDLTAEGLSSLILEILKIIALIIKTT